MTQFCLVQIFVFFGFCFYCYCCYYYFCKVLHNCIYFLLSFLYCKILCLFVDKYLIYKHKYFSFFFFCSSICNAGGEACYFIANIFQGQQLIKATLLFYENKQKINKSNEFSKMFKQFT